MSQAGLAVKSGGGGGGITTIDGDSGSVTGSTVTITGASTGLTTSGVGTVLSLTGILNLASGGTNANLTASNGGIFYSTATAGAILSGTATANQIILSGSSAAPSWSTATYPATTTINQILYSSSSNVITGLATTNRASLSTNATGVPTWLALTDGQLVIGSTAGAPAAATLTAGTGISITNGSNTITIATNGSSTINTLTGNSGGAISPTAGNINTLGTGSITIAGSGSTLTTQLTGLTNHSVLVGAGTATITNLTVGTNGQVLIGATAADPAFATLTSSDGSISFTTGANSLSLQVASGTGVVKTLTGNSGGAISPTAGNINTVGTGSITIVGSGSTLTTQLTGLTNHNVLVGAGTATITNIATGTSGQIFQTQGASADPAWTTATYPSTTTSQQLLYSSAANTVAGLTLPSIPGGRVQYDGTNTNYFDPTKGTFLFDDFIGATSSGSAEGNIGWASGTSGTGAAIAVNKQISNGHPGQMQMVTGSTSSGGVSLRLGANNTTDWPIILGGGALTCIWVVYLPVLSSATDIYAVRFGLTNSNTAQNPANGVYFEYTDPGGGSPTPFWSICTAASSVRTVTQTNVTVQAATWYTLRFDVNAAASSVSYQINGSPTNVGPISTNIPTANIGPNAQILKTGGSTGTTSMEMDVDMFYLYQAFTSAR